jgi:hypothetical protein
MDNWRLVAFVAAYFHRFGRFLPLWRCVWLSAGPSIIVERSFRLLSVLRWLVGLMNDRRTTDAGQRRPQGWGCGGGTIRAHVSNIYMNLCEPAVLFCFCQCFEENKILTINNLCLSWISCEDKMAGFYLFFATKKKKEAPRRGCPHLKVVP